MGVFHETKLPAKDVYVGDVKIADYNGHLCQSGTAITASAAELNALDGLTASAAELNALDGYRHDVYHLSNSVQAYAQRFTLEQVNAGQLIISGLDHAGVAQQWCVLDVKLRAIGGAVTASTSINLVEETSGNIVFSAPVAALIQDAWVTVNTANVVSTYVSRHSTVGKKLSLAVVGNPAETATHLDVIVIYTH